MRKEILAISLIILSGFTIGQSFDSTAFKYSKLINKEDLSKHLHVLASDEYEGRETGKKGQKMAMDYLINQFKSFGIKPYKNDSYVQEFGLIEQKNTGVTVSMGDNKYLINKDFSFSPSIFKNELINTELVFAGYGLEKDYQRVDVRNKAVFIINSIPKKISDEKNSTKAKVAMAKAMGAKAVFIYVEDYKDVLEKYEHYFSKARMQLIGDVKEEVIPVLKVTRDFAESFFADEKAKLDKIEKKGLKKLKSFSKPIKIEMDRPTSNLTSENVLAFIPGTSKKEEVVVLTAHYDHIGTEDSLVFNGADDDGTGTVTLIEIAEAFTQAKKDGFEPKRSILIMPVSGEEKGLLGSKYYTNNPIYPLENTVTNLNIDMIGRYDKSHEEDSNYVYLIGSDKLSDELHQVSETVNKLYINTQLDYTFNDENDPNRFYYRSDHYNFAKNDIPVIFYFSGVHEDYHKATDTVEKIDFKKTERIARLVFLTAWELANREERVKLND